MTRKQRKLAHTTSGSLEKINEIENPLVNLTKQKDPVYMVF